LGREGRERSSKNNRRMYEERKLSDIKTYAKSLPTFDGIKGSGDQRKVGLLKGTEEYETQSRSGEGWAAGLDKS